MLIQKAIHQSNLAGNVEQAENTITLFILEETKEFMNGSNIVKSIILFLKRVLWMAS